MPERTDEEWLREGLADAVPEPPRVPGRASAARERAARSRRRTTAGVLAAAVVVAAAATVTAVAVDRSPDAPPASGPTSGSDQPGPYDPPVCPPPPRPGSRGPSDHLDHPDPDLPDAVPEGAVSARLCQGVGLPFSVPSDALVTDVDQVVAAVNTLAPADPPRTCTADLGRGYRIAFGYADGSTFVVSGKLYGCRELVVGSGYRAHAEIPWGRFTQLLRAQRETAEPLYDPAVYDVTCDHAPTSPVAQATDLAVAALCVGNHAYPIPADDLARLRDDMLVHRSDQDTSACRAVPTRIVGFSAWGDRIDLRSECGTSSYAAPEGYFWTPGPDVARLLGGLLDLSDPRGP